MNADTNTQRPARHPLAGARALKMNGAGNAIVVLDLREIKARDAGFELSAADARAIGAAPGLHFDQLMALYPAVHGAAAAMKIFNIDGSLAQACGNGTRCVAWALMQDQRAAGDSVRLESDAGPLTVARVAGERFTVDMGAPHLDWAQIPLAGQGADTVAVTLAPAVADAPVQFCAVNMGNPHAVFFVDDAAAIDLAKLGAAIEHHPLFPERVNVSFAQICARDDILLRVWERGAGATLACGTAACATLVAASRTGRAERAARIRLPGGDLDIVWRAGDDHVLMTGPVEFEFETRLDAAIFA